MAEKETKLLPEIPVLSEYLAVKTELQNRIEKLNAITVLTEENKKEVKNSIAEINKVKDRISRFRIDETNKFLEYINPYIDKCKELEKMCTEGVAKIKEKVKELETNEKNAKKKTVEELFNFECEGFEFGSLLKFDMFFKEHMANKTSSIPTIQKEMKSWLAKCDEDIRFIKRNTDDPTAVLAIYLDNGLNLTQAISSYQDRFKSEAEIAGLMAEEQAKPDTFEQKIDIVIKIKQLPKSKVSALQAFLDSLKVEWKAEKE